MNETGALVDVAILAICTIGGVVAGFGGAPRVALALVSIAVGIGVRASVMHGIAVAKDKVGL